MAIRLRSNYRGNVSGADRFTVLLFNILLGFILLFFIAILFLSPATKAGEIDIEAEYVITVTLPDNSPDDIDTWIQNPTGNVTWFPNRSSSLVQLDRDDRGMLNDTLTLSGKVINNPLNQQVMAIHGVLPGEYVVNVHYYDSETFEAVPVSVKAARVNPIYSVAYYGKTVLASKGDEKTAIRFTLASNGSVSDLNQLPKKLVPR